MRPKGKLFALLAVFMAIAVVAATGAFTTVTAERTATANTAGDASALLQLEAHDGPNGETYASTSNDVLEITFDKDFNQNATTDIENVFNITNNGGQEVTVNITDAGKNNDIVTFYNSSSGNSIEVGNGVTLADGSTLEVSIKVDTTGQAQSLGSNEELITNFTVHAEAT